MLMIAGRFFRVDKAVAGKLIQIRGQRGKGHSVISVKMPSNNRGKGIHVIVQKMFDQISLNKSVRHR
ncbi:hypothetical protein EMIT07CA2_160001 [Brevibacillus sp. IT-7CA2]